MDVQLPCPRCGEEEGRPILWGFPPPEVMERVESGDLDVVFGGCTVPEVPVNAECRACGARWLHEDPEPVGADRLEAYVGGYWGPSYRIRSSGRHVTWTGTAGDSTATVDVAPVPEAWAQFWASLDACGVCGWEARYEDPAVMDGTSWSLRLAHDGRTLEASGSNAWPPGFDVVRAALEALTGQTWR